MYKCFTFHAAVNNIRKTPHIFVENTSELRRKRDVIPYSMANHKSFRSYL